LNENSQIIRLIILFLNERYNYYYTTVFKERGILVELLKLRYVAHMFNNISNLYSFTMIYLDLLYK
jgi:hypothetical protein